MVALKSSERRIMRLISELPNKISLMNRRVITHYDEPFFLLIDQLKLGRRNNNETKTVEKNGEVGLKDCRRI